MKSPIYDLSLPELSTKLLMWGQKEYRARQVWEGLYHHFWNAAEEFSSISKPIRQKMMEEWDFSVLLPLKTVESTDRQTVKTLFKLHDGKAIEAVLMKFDRRRTLCISSQAGCAMGCVFCATGQMGFKRNLSSGEIVAQVIHYARYLQAQNEKVSNVVVMGMGEPFHNYDNTLSAIDRLNDPDGFNFGARRFTISTVGLVPAIQKFTEEKRQVNLAISLHAIDDTLRASMMPVAKVYPVDQLLAAARNYVMATKRRITFEWALVRDVNDTTDQAQKLAVKLNNYFRIPEHGILCHVNAIPLNPTGGFAGEATTRERAIEFKQILEGSGIPCTIRMRRGIEISAGCGQLAIEQ